MPYKNKEDQKAAGRRAYHRKMKIPEWAERRRQQQREKYKRNGHKYRQRINKKYHEENPRVVGRCPICTLDDQLLVWDHDHSTDKFRAYICNSCNLILAWAKDDMDILNRAIEYLKEHQCQ